MSRYLQVENDEGRVRDVVSGAILNRDTTAYQQYLRTKDRIKKQKQQETAQTNEINNIKTELSEIKELLQTLLREKHG